MIKFIQTIPGLILSYLLLAPTIYFTIGKNGFIGDYIAPYAIWVIIAYALFTAHATITAMSISFHRYHTHRGVTINKYVDYLMQLQVWAVTGMNKADWVAVHRYHHAHSDKEKDPHSPVHKGFWHVFFLGAYDYYKAKQTDPVLRLRQNIREGRFEKFTANNPMLMPYIRTLIIILAFGIQYGSIISIISYFVSPLFAVGGVNAVAHWIGYRNHKSGDNSRNIGFLFPLNFIICGELDHNNHHGNQKSCSFRHKWYEFDIGFVYIKILSWFKLANIKYAYRPQDLKADLSRQFKKILDKNEELKEEIHRLSEQLNVNYHELVDKVSLSFHDRRIKLEKPLYEFKQSCLKLIRQEYIYSMA